MTRVGTLCLLIVLLWWNHLNVYLWHSCKRSTSTAYSKSQQTDSVNVNSTVYLTLDSISRHKLLVIPDWAKLYQQNPWIRWIAQECFISYEFSFAFVRGRMYYFFLFEVNLSHFQVNNRNIEKLITYFTKSYCKWSAFNSSKMHSVH